MAADQAAVRPREAALRDVERMRDAMLRALDKQLVEARETYRAAKEGHRHRVKAWHDAYAYVLAAIDRDHPKEFRDDR